MKYIAGDNYKLSVVDNGIGLPPGFTSRRKNSLGMNLMEGLSEDMNGHFVIENGNGTTITVNFTYSHPETGEHATSFVQQTTHSTTGI